MVFGIFTSLLSASAGRLSGQPELLLPGRVTCHRSPPMGLVDVVVPYRSATTISIVLVLSAASAAASPPHIKFWSTEYHPGPVQEAWSFVRHLTHQGLINGTYSAHQVAPFYCSYAVNPDTGGDMCTTSPIKVVTGKTLLNLCRKSIVEEFYTAYKSDPDFADVDVVQ